MKKSGVFVGLFVAVLFLFVSFVMLWPHRHDREERAACEAKGGVFIEARQPMHVCATPAK